MTVLDASVKICCLFCVQCLCLAPTYELALQIGEVTEKMAKFMEDLKIRYAVRGGERGKNRCWLR